MIKMAREQEFGKPKVILCDAGFSIGDPKQWRLNKKLAGGGSLMDIGIYALNAARYLLGRGARRVNAMEYTTPGDLRFRGRRGDDQLPAALPERRARQLRVQLRRRPQPLPRPRPKGSFELEPALSYSDLRMRAGAGQGRSKRIQSEIDHFAVPPPAAA